MGLLTGLLMTALCTITSGVAITAAGVSTAGPGAIAAGTAASAVSGPLIAAAYANPFFSISVKKKNHKTPVCV